MWIRRLSELALAASLVAGACTAQAQQPAAAGAAEDPMGQFRERFKLGMERYKAGALAEAIGYWEPIYRELGERRGYRLAYNLGVAYAELGDVTRAAERLQSFLAEADARRAQGEAVAPIVEKEEADARARIDAFVASRGRIRVGAGSPPRAAQVDASEPRIAGFVAWVAPGQHTVTFAPGTPEQETKTVDVNAGAIVDVEPSPPPAPPPPPSAIASAPPPASIASPPPPPPVTRLETERPFSPAFIAVSGGMTVAAAVVAVPFEMYGFTLHDRYSQPGYVYSTSDAQRFDAARTDAYLAVGAAIGLAAVTAGLTAWYFLGTHTREVVVTPAGVAGRF